ncbi:MAG: alpha-ketoglutarate-dependent dioxygenase AlkB [Pseudoxanthomonas sp.]
MTLSLPEFCKINELALTGAELRYAPQWMPAAQADALFRELRDSIDWQTHRIRLFGRNVDSPRLSSWIGDAGSSYTYSGVRFEPQAWPTALVAVRQHLMQTLGYEFNSVLANLYRDGRDCMGWHADNEPELGKQPVIASLSLGATRRFVLKAFREPSRKLEIALPHGSLLVMGGDTQQHYRHALPRTARPVAERINLTFRRIMA